jgi:hypothetical protein
MPTIVPSLARGASMVPKIDPSDGITITDMNAVVNINWLDLDGNSISTSQHQIPVWDVLDQTQRSNLQDIRNTIVAYMAQSLSSASTSA